MLNQVSVHCQNYLDMGSFQLCGGRFRPQSRVFDILRLRFLPPISTQAWLVYSFIMGDFKL